MFNNSTEEDETVHSGEENTGIILFLFVSAAIGALVRHILKHTPLPYTVVLLVLGLLFGLAADSDSLKFLREYSTIASIDPHLILFIFLPILIFESAFIMDVHTFKKTILQSLVLAGPGLLVSTFLTALMARYIFYTYSWSWVTSLLFGAILSATDPVSVVALLKELGTSKQLGTVIEGESLLNDGVAIVMFNILLFELVPGQSRSALAIFIDLIRVALGGPLFGYIMARLAIFWLSRVFNNAVVEITITMASAYITYYIGDALLGVSGVLAVVTLGLEMNSRRTSISPEVEAFLHKFWDMLGYLANTIIFILVGVVIAQRAFSGVERMDWVFLVSLYFGIMVIRLLMVVGVSPILVHTGYPIHWKSMLVITWGGLRGAVGLALALVVEQTAGVPQETIGNRVLFLTGGIVLLTLLINASTIRYLLNSLGLLDISNARRLTMATAICRINESKSKAIRLLKSDRFLVDAHWEVVQEKTIIENPFLEEGMIGLCECDGDGGLNLGGGEGGVGGGGGVGGDGGSGYGDIESSIIYLPNAAKISELTEDVRVRILKAERASYWTQYEESTLDREAVLILTNLVDTVMDTPDRLIEIKDIEHYWKIPIYLSFLLRWLKKSLTLKAITPPPPKRKCAKLPYDVVTLWYFDWLISAVVLLDTISTISELIVTAPKVLQALLYLNYAALCVYNSEFILKIIGLRLYYFRSVLNIYDLLVLLVSWVDVVLALALRHSVYFPAVRIIVVFRLLRLTRLFKIFKIVIPLMIKLVNDRINHHLRLGYNIGKAFVVGEEDILLHFNRVTSGVIASITNMMKDRIDISRLNVIRSLGLMRKEYPEVTISVKTRQATGVILNYCRDTITQLQRGGILDKTDADTLIRSVEEQLKRLERSGVALTPPDPNATLHNHPWLSGLETKILKTVEDSAVLENRQPGDVLLQYGERAKGMFIIVTGLVKVSSYKQHDHFSPSFQNSMFSSVLSPEDIPATSFRASSAPVRSHVRRSTSTSLMGQIIQSQGHLQTLPLTRRLASLDPTNYSCLELPGQGQEGKKPPDAKMKQDSLNLPPERPRRDSLELPSISNANNVRCFSLDVVSPDIISVSGSLETIPFSRRSSIGDWESAGRRGSNASESPIGKQTARRFSINISPPDTPERKSSLVSGDGTPELPSFKLPALTKLPELTEYDTCPIPLPPIPSPKLLSPTMYVSPDTSQFLPSDKTLSHNPLLPNTFHGHDYPNLITESFDFYEAGNVMGEIGMLEQGINEVGAICETDVQVFFIEREKLEHLLYIYPILEEKLWKIVGVGIAATILGQLTEYQEWHRKKVILMLNENSHIESTPNPIPVLEVSNEWKHVIVISGTVESVDTREKLHAPCIVPSKVGSLLMDSGNPKVLVVCSANSVAIDMDQYYRSKIQQKYSLKVVIKKFKKLILSGLMRLKNYVWNLILQLCESDGCHTHNRVGSVVGPTVPVNVEIMVDRGSTSHTLEPTSPTNSFIKETSGDGGSGGGASGGGGGDGGDSSTNTLPKPWLSSISGSSTESPHTPSNTTISSRSKSPTKMDIKKPSSSFPMTTNTNTESKLDSPVDAKSWKLPNLATQSNSKADTKSKFQYSEASIVVTLSNSTQPKPLSSSDMKNGDPSPAATTVSESNTRSRNYSDPLPPDPTLLNSTPSDTKCRDSLPTSESQTQTRTRKYSAPSPPVALNPRTPTPSDMKCNDPLPTATTLKFNNRTRNYSDPLPPDPTLLNSTPSDTKCRDSLPTSEFQTQTRTRKYSAPSPPVALNPRTPTPSDMKCNDPLPTATTLKFNNRTRKYSVPLLPSATILNSRSPTPSDKKYRDPLPTIMSLSSIGTIPSSDMNYGGPLPTTTTLSTPNHSDTKYSGPQPTTTTLSSFISDPAVSKYHDTSSAALSISRTPSPSDSKHRLLSPSNTDSVPTLHTTVLKDHISSTLLPFDSNPTIVDTKSISSKTSTYLELNSVVVAESTSSSIDQYCNIAESTITNRHMDVVSVNTETTPDEVQGEKENKAGEISKATREHKPVKINNAYGSIDDHEDHHASSSKPKGESTPSLDSGKRELFRKQSLGVASSPDTDQHSTPDEFKAQMLNKKRRSTTTSGSASGIDYSTEIKKNSARRDFKVTEDESSELISRPDGKKRVVKRRKVAKQGKRIVRHGRHGHHDIDEQDVTANKSKKDFETDGNDARLSSHKRLH